MKIYLAGPISGSSYYQVVDSFNHRSAVLYECGYKVLSPMSGKAELRTSEHLESSGIRIPVATDHAIFERDQWMIQQSDIMFADLTKATRVSIGTMYELAWASLLGKHTVVAMRPEDPYHSHAFVYQSADIIFETCEEAMQYLTNLNTRD